MNLFLELRRHGKLAEKRHPMYEKSKFGKFLDVLHECVLGRVSHFLRNNIRFRLRRRRQKAYHVMNSGLIFILATGLPFAVTLPENTDTGS